MSQNGRVSIRQLKQFVQDNLSKESLLRSVLLSESDELSSQEYLAKLDTWLKIMDFDFSEGCRSESFARILSERVESKEQEEEVSPS